MHVDFHNPPLPAAAALAALCGHSSGSQQCEVEGFVAFVALTLQKGALRVVGAGCPQIISESK